MRAHHEYLAWCRLAASTAGHGTPLGLGPGPLRRSKCNGRMDKNVESSLTLCPGFQSPAVVAARENGPSSFDETAPSHKEADFPSPRWRASISADRR